MTDYTELIRQLKTYEDGYGLYDAAAAAIEELQAEVAELKRVNMEIFEDLPKWGEWIDGDGRRVTARCSVCGHLRLGNGAEYANKYVHFCENCGSKMGGQNDEP